LLTPSQAQRDLQISTPVPHIPTHIIPSTAEEDLKLTCLRSFSLLSLRLKGGLLKIHMRLSKYLRHLPEDLHIKSSGRDSDASNVAQQTTSATKGFRVARVADAKEWSANTLTQASKIRVCSYPNTPHPWRKMLTLTEVQYRPQRSSPRRFYGQTVSEPAAPHHPETLSSPSELLQSLRAAQCSLNNALADPLGKSKEDMKSQKTIPSVYPNLHPSNNLNPIRKKAIRIAHACDNCRVARAKCDEGRPSCSRCKQDNAECTYWASLMARQGTSYQIL